MNTLKKEDMNKDISLHKNPRTKEKLYKQKLAGAVIIILNIIAAYIGNDSTAAIILVPFGSVLFFSKNKLLDL